MRFSWKDAGSRIWHWLLGNVAWTVLTAIGGAAILSGVLEEVWKTYSPLTGISGWSIRIGVLFLAFGGFQRLIRRALPDQVPPSEETSLARRLERLLSLGEMLLARTPQRKLDEEASDETALWAEIDAWEEVVREELADQSFLLRQVMSNPSSSGTVAETRQLMRHRLSMLKRAIGSLDHH